MANNKSDSSTPKTMDVMQPGKAVPPATSRPVIVSNRPMLRQDPMMVSPDGIEKPEAQQTRQTVSRVGKTLTVLAPHQSKTAKAPTVMPLTVTDKTENTDAVPVTVAAKPASPVIPQGRTPAEIASKKAIPVQADEATPDNTPSTTMPAQPEAPAVSASEPTGEAPKPVEPETVDQTMAKPAPSPSPAPSTPQVPAQASAASTPAPVAAPSTTEDDISADTESNTDSPRPDGADGQLAPNKTIDEAKKKADEAEAARDAEEEQIIDSKRFYLPITNVEVRRGLTRSLLVLLVVIALTVVWFDVVLDAGVVHVGNLHALTHFFR